MCGIAGYVGRTRIEQQRLDACLTLMRRRGPDHQAHCRYTTPDGRLVDFLHSRLSIIDLDPRANQPFQSGTRSLVYNGELYNYVEVRDDLLREGATFRTDSDTEVLLQAVNHWGLDAFDRFEGMWALAIFDASDGSVLLSRDRFGEKPLHVLRDPSGFYFASEVKFISALRGFPPTVDGDQVRRFLVNGYKALYKEPRSFFRGVTELAPARALMIDAEGREGSRTYWAPRFAPRDAMSFEEAVAEARRHVIRTVELRLRADVPMAFCMSGGVDSNALIAIAKRVFGYDVHGFTIVDEDGRYDEETAVRESVAALGVRHTVVRTCTSGFLAGLRTLVRQHDAPVYTISYYAHWMLMEQIAKAGYRISVSGSAADELFTGYYDHHLAYLREVHKYPDIHGPARDAWAKHVQPIVRNPFLGQPDLFIERPEFRDHIYLHADRFAGWLTGPWSEPFAEHTFTSDLLRNRMLNEMFFEAVPVILHEDDSNAMYYSIENRSPFLDRRLFEFCFEVPTRHLVQDGTAKAVLREAMRGIVPDAVLDNRQKVGFNAAIHSFLDVNDPATREELLADSPVFEIVKRGNIAALLDERDLANSESKFLFSFIATKMFLEECAA